MSETQSDITGNGLVESGAQYKDGDIDLFGNKVVKVNTEKNQQVVEYGVATMKNGEVIELTYRDFQRLMRHIDTGQKGVLMFDGGKKGIDVVMIAKVATQTRIEDAPISMKPQVRDEHLRERQLAYYKAETNLDGKGWTWQDITVENGKQIIKALSDNDKNIRTRVRQLKPVYKMAYVTEQRDGQEYRVDRKLDHVYPDIPLTRISEYGDEVVLWYWAKPFNDEPKKGKKRTGYKKVVEQSYNEQTGQYELPKRLDACTPDEVTYLERGGY